MNKYGTCFGRDEAQMGELINLFPFR